MPRWNSLPLSSRIRFLFWFLSREFGFSGSISSMTRSRCGVWIEWPRQLKATRQVKVVCSSAVMTSSTAEWLLHVCSADSPTEAMTWRRLTQTWQRNSVRRVRFKVKIVVFRYSGDLCHQGKPFNWRRLAGDMKVKIISEFLLCQVKCHMSVIPTMEAETAAGRFICKTDFNVYLFFFVVFGS